MIDPTMSGMPPAAGGESGGFMASLMNKLPQPQGQPLRPVPGAGAEPNDFYDRLAQADPTAEAELKKVIKDVRQRSLDGRDALERGWWQKLLYLHGRQWIYYAPRAGWQDKRLARWIPRPVTNICSTTVETIHAIIQTVTPSARIRPNGNNPVNVITAQLADQLEPVIAEEHRMPARWYEADWWAPAIGTVFLHPCWDRDDPRNQTFVQAMQCPECQYLAHPLDLEEGALPGCPECGTPAEMFQPGVDERGPIGEHENLGAGRTDIVTALELLFPTYYQRWEDVGELIRMRWRPKTWYEGRPYFDQIRFSSSNQESSLTMFRQLATMTDLTTSPFTGSYATQARETGCVESELWIRPTPKYPEGLWARVVGGLQGDLVIVRDDERGIVPGPLPYRDFEDKVLWPWVRYPYQEIGGRVWAKGCLENIIQKQDQLNRNDSMVELIMQRMANPIWLEPKGAEVQRFTGEPGLIVRYQVVAGTNAKPERLEGSTPGQAFFALRQQYFEDAERLTGTRDVLQGIQPGGIEAFSALNLLVERSQAHFTPMFKARGRAYREWYMLALELERSYGPAERTKPVLGGSDTWTFQTFKRQDLAGSISVIVEDGAEQPKTALGKRAALQQGQVLGVIDVQNPQTQYRALELLGIPEIAPNLDEQTKASQIEQDKYLTWVDGGRQGPNPLVVLSTDEHPIHIQQLDLWASSDRVRERLVGDPTMHDEVTFHRVQHIVASTNPFGLPIPPPGVMMPGMGAPAGPGGAPAPAGPPGMGAPVEGAARGPMNSDAESDVVNAPQQPTAGAPA